MDEIEIKAIKYSAEDRFAANRFFKKCKNLSQYPIIHGSKRTLLHPGAFGLYVPLKAILKFELRAQYSILKAW